MDISVWLGAWPQLALALGLGYLLGSIPFGLMLARLAGLGDIRSIGSGNIGATNVLRTGSKAIAGLTLVCDIGKGTAAVLLARALFATEGAPDPGLAGAAGAMLGHVFTVWLRFRGGKGVATALGIYFGLAWPVGVVACLTWLLTAVLFRYSSVAALAAVTAAPGYMLHFADEPTAWLAGLIGALVWVRHWSNIRRLVAGEESKIKLEKRSE